MNKELISVEELINKCSRSINTNSLTLQLEHISGKYINSKLEKKYLVEGYEHLSKLVQNIIKSGRGYYTVKYAHDKKINVCVTGINNSDLLIDYAKWCWNEGEKALFSLQEDILKLLEEENKMSIEEIRLKNIEYLETKKKILENIYDMEKKAPYCEKLRTLDTVEQKLNSFIEMTLLFYPLEEELKRLGLIE